MMREPRKCGLFFSFWDEKEGFLCCPGLSSRDVLYACAFCALYFGEADCVVDGIKPTLSVDSIGLLALMGWMNAEYCGLE